MLYASLFNLKYVTEGRIHPIDTLYIYFGFLTFTSNMFQDISVCIYTFKQELEHRLLKYRWCVWKQFLPPSAGMILITLNFYYNMEYICFFILTSPDQEINFVMIVKKLILYVFSDVPKFNLDRGLVKVRKFRSFVNIFSTEIMLLLKGVL